jgi:hypothetical protein
MICVTWGTNESMTLTCLRSNMLLFFFLLARCGVLYLQQGIKRYTLGWWGGGGGDKGVQGCQYRQQNIKHHQEYIQSLMKFHFPGMLDINSTTNVNWLHSSHLINDKRQAHK